MVSGHKLYPLDRFMEERPINGYLPYSRAMKTLNANASKGHWGNHSTLHPGCCLFRAPGWLRQNTGCQSRKSNGLIQRGSYVLIYTFKYVHTRKYYALILQIMLCVFLFDSTSEYKIPAILSYFFYKRFKKLFDSTEHNQLYLFSGCKKIYATQFKSLKVNTNIRSRTHYVLKQ